MKLPSFLKPTQISPYSPNNHMGSMYFDPDKRATMMYDGIGWKEIATKDGRKKGSLLSELGDFTNDEILETMLMLLIKAGTVNGTEELKEILKSSRLANKLTNEEM